MGQSTSVAAGSGTGLCLVQLCGKQEVAEGAPNYAPLFEAARVGEPRPKLDVATGLQVDLRKGSIDLVILGIRWNVLAILDEHPLAQVITRGVVRNAAAGVGESQVDACRHEIAQGSVWVDHQVDLMTVDVDRAFCAERAVLPGVAAAHVVISEEGLASQQRNA